MAVPQNLLTGHSNPYWHNTNNLNSIFTSWTIYKSFAARWAGKNGWGGIILTKKFQKWQVQLSPDLFRQGEVLIPGVVSGAKPENARPSNY